MNEKECALRIAKLREQKGVSARDMSLSLGQNPGYINNIETGKSMPSLSALLYICEYLNITPAQFFDSNSKHPEKLENAINQLKKLDDRQLNLILELIKEITKK